MSSKSTIFLSGMNEHFYFDRSEPLQVEPYREVITLEFSKENIRVDVNDDEDLIISLTNPSSEIYELFRLMGL